MPQPANKTPPPPLAEDAPASTPNPVDGAVEDEEEAGIREIGEVPEVVFTAALECPANGMLAGGGGGGRENVPPGVTTSAGDEDAGEGASSAFCKGPISGEEDRGRLIERCW